MTRYLKLVLVVALAIILGLVVIFGILPQRKSISLHSEIPEISLAFKNKIKLESFLDEIGFWDNKKLKIINSGGGFDIADVNSLKVILTNRKVNYGPIYSARYSGDTGVRESITGFELLKGGMGEGLLNIWIDPRVLTDDVEYFNNIFNSMITSSILWAMNDYFIPTSNLQKYGQKYIDENSFVQLTKK